MQNLSTKLVNIKKRLFGKLVLACEGEILDTTETLIFNLKVTYGENNCLAHTTSSFELCASFLVMIFIICYYYYTINIVLKMNVYYHINVKNE